MTLSVVEVLGLIFGAFSGVLMLVVMNWREHKELHLKIDSVHHSMRDRLDRIWKHLNGNTPGS